MQHPILWVVLNISKKVLRARLVKSAVARSYQVGWIDYTLQNILDQKFWQWKMQNAKTLRESLADQSPKSTDLRQTQRVIDSWLISTVLVLYSLRFSHFHWYSLVFTGTEIKLLSLGKKAHTQTQKTTTTKQTEKQ